MQIDYDRPFEDKFHSKLKKKNKHNPNCSSHNTCVESTLFKIKPLPL